MLSRIRGYFSNSTNRLGWTLAVLVVMVVAILIALGFPVSIALLLRIASVMLLGVAVGIVYTLQSVNKESNPDVSSVIVGLVLVMLMLGAGFTLFFFADAIALYLVS